MGHSLRGERITDVHPGPVPQTWDIANGAWMALTEQQFAAVVSSYGPTLRRVLLRLTHGRTADADDLLQRTFERAWLKRDTFLGGEVEPWIRGIARFEHLNHLRHRGQQQRLKEKAYLESKSKEPILQPEPQEENESIGHCLKGLGEQDRRIVDVFYGRRPPGPLTDREIGELLTNEAKAAGKRGDTWSVDRVRTRRHRAIKNLRRCMAARAKAQQRGDRS